MRLLLCKAAAFFVVFMAPACALAAPHIITRPLHDRGTPQWSEGALWRTDRGFDSYLRLKNVLLTQPLTVTPVLYMADGYEVDLPPLTLDPAGVASINIRTALRDAGFTALAHTSAYGMAGVKYNWSWSAVLATVQNIDEIESITFHSSLGADAEAVHDPSTPKADRLIQGLWWAPGAQAAGFVALENTGHTAVTAQVALTDAQGGPLARQAVPLPPHGTVLLPLEDILADVQDPNAAGSINITYNGAAHGVLAYEGVEDRKAGYSASPNLTEVSSDLDFDPPAPASVQLASPGVMVGKPEPKMLFPAGTAFQPYAYLQNRSTQPLSVTVSAVPVQGGTPAKLGTVSLAPGASLKADLPTMMKQAGFVPSGEYVTLLFSYQGVPGDVAAEVGSTDQTRNYVFEVLPTIEAATISKTICYWLIAGDTDTMISIWNYTDAPTDELLTLYFARGQYKLPLHLTAGETRVLNVKAVQRDQVPDADGHVLPTDITEGSAILSSAKGETEKMPVAVSVASFNVRNGTCGANCTSCNGVSSFTMSPNPGNIQPIDTMQFTGTETYNTGSTQNATAGTWSSSATSVATVNGSGVTTGVAAGQSNIGLLIDDVPLAASNVCSGSGTPSCPVAAQMSASGPVNVAVPSIQIRFSGAKSPGDNLMFGPPTCTQSLGAETCSGFWGFNVEAVITTPTSIAGYTVTQQAISGYYRGTIKNTTTGVLAPFSGSPGNGPDGPDSSNIQNQGTGNTIYYIDDPGARKQFDQNDVVDAGHYAFNFLTQVCRNATGACVTSNWYENLLIDGGGVLDSKSSAGIGSTSTTF